MYLDHRVDRSGEIVPEIFNKEIHIINQDCNNLHIYLYVDEICQYNNVTQDKP